MKDLTKIKRQLEFYFSDANYSKDKFLREKCAAGGIDISVLLTFKKLKELDCTSDDIKNILKDNETVKIEDDKIIRIENDEYKKYVESNVENKTIIIKGFNKNMKMEEIEKYLNNYFTPVLIRMRKDKAKNFNGNIMVECKTEEDAKKILEMKLTAPEIEKEETVEEEKPEENKKRKIAENNDNKEDIKKVKTSENDNKKEPKLLSVMMKKEYLLLKKETEKKDKIKQTLLKEFKNKIFEFKTEREMNVKEIKGIVDGVAFVDLKENVLRFKKEQNFEKNEYVDESGDKVIVSKMEEEKEIEYIQKLKIEKPIKKKKKH